MLYGDDHPLSNLIVQKAKLTCASAIEKGYYNHPERGLKHDNICYHCGEGGTSDFILDLDKLKRRCLTGGYKCFPICIDCLGRGKKPGHSGSKNELQVRKERKGKTSKTSVSKAK